MYECSVCGATHKAGSRWEKVRAHGKGWFVHRETEVAYCPDHIPEWVAAWRANKSKGDKS